MDLNKAEICKRLAHGEASLEDMEGYVKMNDEHVNTLLAESTKASQAIINCLSYNSSEMVVCRIAMRRDLSWDMLERLSKHESPHVRCCVASNKDITPGILDMMKDDSDHYVKVAVYNNKKVTPEIRKHIGFKL